MRRTSRKRKPAFTLAELLISLAILGVIATFTIPKVLQAQRDGRYNAAAKEAAGSIATAFTMHQSRGLVGSGTSATDLSQYMNYVKIDTATAIDSVYNNPGSLSCTGINPCVLLHNGGLLYFRSMTFNGTASTNALSFFFDPDGTGTSIGTATGPGKSVIFFLYYNGRMTSGFNDLPGTTDSLGPYSSPYGLDPDWFSWN